MREHHRCAHTHKHKHEHKHEHTHTHTDMNHTATHKHEHTHSFPRLNMIQESSYSTNALPVVPKRFFILAHHTSVTTLTALRRKFFLESVNLLLKSVSADPHHQSSHNCPTASGIPTLLPPPPPHSSKKIKIKIKITCLCIFLPNNYEC